MAKSAFDKEVDSWGVESEFTDGGGDSPNRIRMWIDPFDGVEADVPKQVTAGRHPDTGVPIVEERWVTKPAPERLEVLTTYPAHGDHELQAAVCLHLLMGSAERFANPSEKAMWTHRHLLAYHYVKSHRFRDMLSRDEPGSADAEVHEGELDKHTGKVARLLKKSPAQSAAETDEGEE
jgi:hypothetical protein